MNLAYTIWERHTNLAVYINFIKCIEFAPRIVMPNICMIISLMLHDAKQYSIDIATVSSEKNQSSSEVYTAVYAQSYKTS